MDDTLKQEILTALKKRGYHEVTVTSYSSRLFKLFEYYPSIPPLEITNKQVTKYAQSLISRNYSASTIRALFYACSFYYDELNNKKHGHYKVKLPPEKEQQTEFFKQDDILAMIEHKTNLKHKAIILLMYSCGLEASDIINLRLEHIRTKPSRPHIQIVDKFGTIKRKAFLSKRILPDLRKYYHIYEPKTWLFYGATDKDKQFTAGSIRKIIDDSISALNLNPLLKSKSLRHTYMKHMTELGVPLIKVLNDLELNAFDTHLKYSKIIHGESDIMFSPIDRRLNEDTEIEDFKDLEHLVFELEDKNEVDYLIEGLECFRCGALRAGVIFIWSASIRNIRQKIIEKANLKKINEELSFIDNKARKIKNIDSFEYIKDETTLQLSERLGIYGKFEKNELTNTCLGLRNKCGHPSTYKPDIFKVKAFVEDILNMVYKK
jgi:site-specific recombinase XerD